MQNKRSIPRQKKRLHVEVQGSPVFTVDVSPGGFCAEAMRVYEPGSKVEGKIRFSNMEVPFQGQVAWAKAGDPRLQLRGRMGVRITRIAPEYQKLFEPPSR